MILILNYGLANLKSVKNAFEIFTDEVIISSKLEDIEKADKIILPGVGSFAEGMKNLREGGYIPLLEEAVIKKKKPILGICLGMQLLATKGYEYGETEGLGWIKGEVRKINSNNFDEKVPHMGWDDITITKDNCLLKGIRSDKDFYFVHSYHLIPEDKDIVSATCDYTEKIVASIQKDNIFATQFHPEKSQKNGLNVIQRFIEWEPGKEPC